MRTPAIAAMVATSLWTFCRRAGARRHRLFSSNEALRTGSETWEVRRPW